MWEIIDKETWGTTDKVICQIRDKETWEIKTGWEVEQLDVVHLRVINKETSEGR